MLRAGQRVEIAAGDFAGLTGVVVSRDELAERNLECADPLLAIGNETLVLLTVWGRELIVALAPNDVQAI